MKFNKKSLGTILLTTTILGAVVSTSGVALADTTSTRTSDNVDVDTSVVGEFPATGGIDPDNPVLTPASDVTYISNQDFLNALKVADPQAYTALTQKEINELLNADGTRKGTSKIVRKNGKTYIYLNSIIAKLIDVGKVSVAFIAAAFVAVGVAVLTASLKSLKWPATKSGWIISFNSKSFKGLKIARQ